jgi:hypothetical protein
MVRHSPLVLWHYEYVRAPTIGTTVYMRQRLRVVVEMLSIEN